MNRLQIDAILISLVENLRARGSWCGETHVQKATYFLQNLMKVPLSFDFVLYKHGPYSFELTDEITAMRADNLLALQSQSYPYGPSLVPTPAGIALRSKFPKTLGQYSHSIEFVAQQVGTRNVAELERLATALYVTLHNAGNREARAHRLHEIKPHISPDEAYRATEAVDDIIQMLS
jgi:hypothetical protein